MKKIICIFAFVLFLSPAAGLGDTLRIKGTSVELRAEPNREARVAAYAGEGKEFEVVKTLASGWYAVRLPNNMVVWVERGESIEVLRAPVVAKAPPKKEPVPEKKAEVVAVKREATPEEKERKPEEETAPERPVKKPEEAAPEPAVAEVKKAPSPAPAVGKKPPPAEAKAEKRKRPPPQFISSPEVQSATTLISRGPFLAVINLIFGAVCLLVARRKGRSLLAWFTLGAYFTIISLIVVLLKKRSEEPAAPKIALKIVSIVFLVIWFAVMGGLYMFTQNALRDRQTIQDKVNIYTLQVHKRNYKGAYLLFSPRAQRQLPYKRFVRVNETVDNALGALKRYQLTKFDIGYGDRPTTIVYTGTFEKGKGTIIFTMVKEGGLVGVLRPGDWTIVSVDTSSSKLLEYMRAQKKKAS